MVFEEGIKPKGTLDFIMAIVMILFGVKLVITPANQLVEQFPKMPSVKGSKSRWRNCLNTWHRYLRSTNFNVAEKNIREDIHINSKIKTETGLNHLRFLQ